MVLLNLKYLIFNILNISARNNTRQIVFWEKSDGLCDYCKTTLLGGYLS